jgi:arylsulfatase A-like enzyme
MAVFAQSADAVAPNIIVIVTDDHRAAGTMDISDENLDPMKKTKGWFHTGDLQVPGRDPVAGGTKFPNGIVTTPLCCPARTSIFTGQYIHNHGVTNNGVAQNILDDKTLQEYLNPTYHTGIFGKYLNNWDQRLEFKVSGSFVPPHWDKWATFEGQMFPVRVNEQGAYKTVIEYSTDYLARKSTEFIQATPQGEPFFLYVAPTAPHTPWVPEAAYADKPVPPWSEITSSPKFFEADRSDKPDWVQDAYGSGNNLEEARDAQIRMLYSVDAPAVADRLLEIIDEAIRDQAFSASSNRR